MNQSKIFVDGVVRQLCDGATLVTANERLAREIRQQFNRHQLNQGRQVWDTADILPFEAWVFRLWQFIHDQSATKQCDRRIVLNALQSKAVWTQIISEDIKTNQRDSQPLWNIAVTTKAVMAAWRISRQWGIATDECAKSLLADHRRFARWANLFLRQCQKNNWIDVYQLIDVVMDEWTSASALMASELTDADLIWMGFDEFNAQQQRLMSILRQNNVGLLMEPFADSGLRADCQLREYECKYEQWLATAHWIKDKLERDPNQRLAVVAPNLHKSRDVIEYALNQVLSPHHLFDSGSSRPKPFHISFGVTLSDAPVVDAALLLLSLAVHENLTNSTIGKVILNPFIGGADSECHARNKFEFRCRQYLPGELMFSDFLESLKRWRQQEAGTQKEQKQWKSAPLIFVEKINANSALLASSKETQLFSWWAEFFLRWLENFGWPGERALNNEQHQTVEAFRREVCILRSLDMSEKAVTVATALAVLRQHLIEQLFEPESAHVNIDVLGIMETTGIKFDAIWFGDLTEKDWPPALQASPFIPYQLQQQAGYHRASVSLNADHAGKQQHRLLHQCGEMVLSCYRSDRDVALLPNAFFQETNESQSLPIPCSPSQPNLTGLIESLQKHKPQLEICTDTQGLKKSDPDTRGGTSVIRDQAACPFRAYAKHRLGARDVDTRQAGLDEVDRGRLIHHILEGIWQTLQSSQKLAAISADAFQQIIDDNIAISCKRYFHRSSMGKEFFQVQKQWLRRLLLEWFAVEKNRKQAFRIVELEKQQQLTLGKLTLNFKIDRIDALADKTLMLIDYKTGRVGAITSWFGNRPKEPQLPLYALAQHANTNEHENNHENNHGVVLSALRFGQVRAGQSAYVGISQEELLQIAKRVAGKLSESENIRLSEALKSWHALMEYWDEQLTTLANQYYAGYAAVHPLDKTTCNYCDLFGLCRIGEADTNQLIDVSNNDPTQ